MRLKLDEFWLESINFRLNRITIGQNDPVAGGTFGRRNSTWHFGESTMHIHIDGLLTLGELFCQRSGDGVESFDVLHIEVGVVVDRSMDDCRRDEDQQLGSLEALFAEFEELANEWDVCQARNAVSGDELSFFEEPTKHNRLAIEEDCLRRDLFAAKDGRFCVSDTVRGVLDIRDFDADREIDGTFFGDAGTNIEEDTDVLLLNGRAGVESARCRINRARCDREFLAREEHCFLVVGGEHAGFLNNPSVGDGVERFNDEIDVKGAQVPYNTAIEQRTEQVGQTLRRNVQ